MAMEPGPLVNSCLESFYAAPGVIRMRREGPAGQWAADLLRLAGRPELEPLRPTLTALARGGLDTFAGIGARLADSAPGTDPMAYARAAAVGQEELGRAPGAAYLVTLASVLGWTASLGERYGDQVDGMPHPGWVTIPYAFAQAALALGDVLNCREVVQAGYDMLMAAKYPDVPALVAGIGRYRSLGRDAERRFQREIDNLADDMALSAQPGPDSLRAQQLALMWTLGFVPECQGLRRSGGSPSRSMLRTLIRVSLERIQFDPLARYVWLQMKDRPSLDLRGHSFFFVVNRRYPSYRPDQYWPVAPSEVYARTLTAWLDDRLDGPGADEFLSVAGAAQQDAADRQGVGASEASILARILALAYVVAGEQGWAGTGMSADRELELWQSLLREATRIRGRHHLYPEVPDFDGTLNHALFQVIEQGLQPGAAAGPDSVILALEQHRAAAMAFSLAVTPPGIGPGPEAADDPEAFGPLSPQARERQLLHWLRGAAFTIRFPYLPSHLHRYTADALIVTQGREYLTTKAGREDYLELERALDDLYDEWAGTAGSYVRIRRDPAADVPGIVEALGQHAAIQAGG
jgi:hypothetical protein